MSNLGRLLAVWLPLALLAWGAGSLQVQAYPLTDVQKQRLKQYLPLTLEKLERQMPIHVALIGDEVAGMSTLDEKNGNLFFSLHGFFLQGLEREFFYTGGVKWLNPPGDLPGKPHGHRGDEITVETFTSAGATALHALQALTTRVFLRKTDLVLIHVGLNDYRCGIPLDSMSRSIATALAICRAQGAELALAGPAPLREGEALREWGGIRQVAGELRLAAEGLGVMFLDPTLELMHTHPAAGDSGLEEKTIQLSNSLRMDFLDYGPGKIENARINARAHKRAGQGIFRQFLNGVPDRRLHLSGEATRTGTETLRLDLVVENPGAMDEVGILAPLNAGEDWIPAKPAEAIKLKPNSRTTVCLEYERRPNGRDRLTTGCYCFPFLYSGLDETVLLELDLVPSPVAVRWNYTSLRGVEKQFPLKFTLCNPGKDPARGSYEITYDRQQSKGNFLVEPQKEREYTVQWVLPGTGEQMRRKDPVVLKITSGQVSFGERRVVEITRNLALGQKLAMARRDKYEGQGSDGRVDGGVNLEVRADPESLWAAFDLGDRTLEDGPGQPALLVDITVDARPRDERHEFGFVNPLRIAFGAQPGAGTVSPIESGSFGNFYDKILSEAGIQAQLALREDGSRKTVTIRVPRIYLYRHEWRLGSADCTLGFSARLRFLRTDPEQRTCDYPPTQEWVLASPSFGEWHAGGLPGLELITTPSPRWAVRLY